MSSPLLKEELYEYYEDFLPEEFKEMGSKDEKSKEVSSTFRKTIMKDLQWEVDPKIMIFGKEMKIPRDQTAYGDEGLVYRYSGKDVQPLPWTSTLLKIKDFVNEKFSTNFNFVLCNYYADGTKYIGYHADDEKDLSPDAPIVSLSFGAKRRFLFKTSDTINEVVLKNNSCFVMKAGFQTKYKHSVPKQLKVKKPRLNLTFREIRKKQK